MILSFGCKDCEKIWEGDRVGRFSIELQETARRKLRMLNRSGNLNDLATPPSNRLEKLKGTLRDYYSIRINGQWRIIFRWQSGDAKKVEIIDYH
jgi:proteic killer suppression protein